ncbi:hypothetical protein GIB67_017481 [Kingdonia uniflora]|uniref:Uncharacterized protein n=1 Tax=Kingdonia uniflora TaxID=39325 RepID=A0A7J7M4Q0_9MAGN|nr:hypothetical protein GIB67_017481 [Kingdonia uniflora]
MGIRLQVVSHAKQILQRSLFAPAVAANIPKGHVAVYIGESRKKSTMRSKLRPHGWAENAKDGAMFLALSPNTSTLAIHAHAFFKWYLCSTFHELLNSQVRMMKASSLHGIQSDLLGHLWPLLGQKVAVEESVLHETHQRNNTHISWRSVEDKYGSLKGSGGKGKL